ncbi:MAG: hypothetical protein COX17_06880 [Deltaproteobacteria bacterium CG23_combo_of_CG06-09_8_20_14_all_60_8]|nr:MAG: hypothetical protein AUK28_06235 [Desulfobacterales bacterium CG2_30_60_27]PIP43469.1 MAG: hypothetical protein COX17_06880 [Deltaproteobacteria bacterium CG23_combo_of_CG06-09_8_20_14_all_60_8]
MALPDLFPTFRTIFSEKPEYPAIGQEPISKINAFISISYTQHAGMCFMAHSLQQQQDKGERKMTLQRAIQILMESPIYFRLDLPARKVLIKEFRARFAE